MNFSKWSVKFEESQSFEGGVYGKEDLINKFSQYLIDKGVIKK